MKKKRDTRLTEKLIKIWNDEHIELLQIQLPDEKNNFSGVVKLFYFEKNNEIQTRCIKVSNMSTVEEALFNFLKKNDDHKFLRDYSIYAVYSNGEYKLLSNEDSLLLEQLSWVEDAIDGRFLVRGNILLNSHLQKTSSLTNHSPKSSKIDKNNISTPQHDNIDQSIKDLFDKIPSNPYNSGINNQDCVLKRQRQQKLSKKIKEFMEYELQHGLKNSPKDENAPPKLGTLKIFISSIYPEASYKTVMVSIYDNARSVVKELLVKFRTYKIDLDEKNLFLTMLIISKKDKEKCGKLLKKARREYCILDDDCPLMLQSKYSSENCFVSFHLRRRICSNSSVNQQIGDAAKKAMLEKNYFAILCELNISQSLRPSDHPPYILVNRDIVAIGNNTFNLKEAKVLGQKPSQLVVLKHHSIHPLHCVISGLNGVLSIIPTLIDSDVRIDGNQIYESTTLLNGSQVTIGCAYFFQVFIPSKVSATTSPIYWKRFQYDSLCNTPKKTELEMDETALTNSSEISLPLRLKFHKIDFEAIFSQILKLLFNTMSEFKLSAAYLMYISFIAQYDNCIKTDGTMTIEKTTSALKEFHGFCKICSKIVDESIIYNNQSFEILLMWLGNISEFLYFLSHDIFLYSVTEEVQKFCEHCIRVTVNEITRKIEENCANFLEAFYTPFIHEHDLSEELRMLINFDPALGEEKENKNKKLNVSPKRINSEFVSNGEKPPTILDVMRNFNESLSLFCQYQINPSFTAQIFQRIFNYICKCLIDEIIITMDYKRFVALNLGESLKAKLNIIFLWGESQGVEAVMCKCFNPLIKLLDFLNSKMNTLEKLKESVAACDSLNSLQIEEILNKWKFSGATKICDAWKKSAVEHSNLINCKKNQFTGNIKLEFQCISIKPCFITQDGYTSENPQEISNKIYELIKDLNIPDIEVIESYDNRVYWNCRFEDKFDGYKLTDKKAEYMFITIEKDNNTFWGMRIVSIRNSSTGNEGIYVRSIEENSISKKDGRIAKGDQLVSVNDISLVGVQESKAAQIIASCGNILRIELLKNSAFLHGIERYLHEKQSLDDNTKNSNPKIKRNNISQSIPIPFPNSNYSPSQANLEYISLTPVEKQNLQASGKPSQIVKEIKCHKLFNKETILNGSNEDIFGSCKKASSSEKIKREKEYQNLILMNENEKKISYSPTNILENHSSNTKKTSIKPNINSIPLGSNSNRLKMAPEHSPIKKEYC